MGYKVGEKSKGICGRCHRVVTTTFEKRIVEDVPRSHSDEESLVSVCDVCGTIVGIVPKPTKKRKGK